MVTLTNTRGVILRLLATRLLGEAGHAGAVESALGDIQFITDARLGKFARQSSALEENNENAGETESIARKNQMVGIGARHTCAQRRTHNSQYYLL